MFLHSCVFKELAYTRKHRLGCLLAYFEPDLRPTSQNTIHRLRT
jgi:hypothetical protein